MSELTLPERQTPQPTSPAPRWGVRIYRAAVLSLLAIIAWNSSYGEIAMIAFAIGVVGVLFGRD